MNGQPDAVVVGAGPNGLAAALRLSAAGLRVQVVDAGERPGGGMRTEELMRPGFFHDVCSIEAGGGSVSFATGTGGGRTEMPLRAVGGTNGGGWLGPRGGGDFEGIGGKPEIGRDSGGVVILRCVVAVLSNSGGGLVMPPPRGAARTLSNFGGGLVSEPRGACEGTGEGRRACDVRWVAGRAGCGA